MACTSLLISSAFPSNLHGTAAYDHPVVHFVYTLGDIMKPESGNLWQQAATAYEKGQCCAKAGVLVD